MIGVIVVTHGPLADGLVASATRLAGPLHSVRAITVNVNEPPEQIADRIAFAARQVDAGQGVLFLVDLPGSTPANLCLAEARGRPGSAMLSGVNLPMLLKLETADRESSPRKLAEQLEITAIRSIQLSDLARDPQS